MEEWTIKFKKMKVRRDSQIKLIKDGRTNEANKGLENDNKIKLWLREWKKQ